MKKSLLLFILLFLPKLVDAASLSATKNLSFGTLAPVSASGSIVIGLNSSINTNGTATVAPTGTAYYAGQLTYNGSELTSFPKPVTMTFLNSSVNLTNSSGGTVVVNNFTITPNLYVSNYSSTATANVGGIANFSGASTPGNYTGTVQIRAETWFSSPQTVSLPITLTLWRPLTISQTKQLDFGAINVSTGNAVVRMSSQNGSRTVVSGGAGITLISSLPGNPAEFLIKGQSNTSVFITVSSSTTLTGPGAPMTVNNFNRRPGTSALNLNSNGEATLKIGADLNINANQGAGVYNGTYNVTINY